MLTHETRTAPFLAPAPELSSTRSYSSDPRSSHRLKTWRGSLARLRRGRRQQQPARRVTCKKSSSALPRALTCTSPSRASCRPEEAAASSSCRSAAASAERWRRTRASAKPQAVTCRSAAAAKAVACRSAAAAKAVARLSGTNRVTRAQDGARACGTKPTCRRRRGCWRTEAIARGESYRSLPFGGLAL